MKNKNRFLEQVRRLLSQKLPATQAQELLNEGFDIKSPTRQSALAVALYKKAEKGDLSAIRELCAMLDTSDGETAEQTGAVVIIDDL